jgi:sulfur dioxygenase
MIIFTITMKSKIFKQLYDKETGTFTYIIADSNTKNAIIIDSVKSQTSRDLKLIKELNLNLKYILDTHVHADHITAAYTLKQETGAKIVLGKENIGVENTDIFLDENETLELGTLKIKTILTPGHTNGCTTYQIDNELFTGDTLLVRSVGRTDFQHGSNQNLYNSIQKLYSYPNDTIIWIGHNYNGHNHTTIKEEKEHNNFVKENTSFKEFDTLMKKRELPLPKHIKKAVPVNLKSGKL